MRNKILCLCLSLFMVVSYLPASVMTAFAAPIDNLETNKEDTSPKLILDKESDIKVYNTVHMNMMVLLGISFLTLIQI